MKTIDNCEDMSLLAQELRAEGKTIGVVPTMGALHQGHLSLVNTSLQQTDVTVATIFLNPTQFAPGEDLDAYPRPLDADLAKLEAAGVDYVFLPTSEEMYPDDLSTRVLPPVIAKKLEGEFRPAHFEGVVTIVLKLLNVTRADIGFFGQKDLQQALVIKQMVKDLNVPTEVRVCPIVREPDGLALSSRNVFLSDDEREIALSISRTLDNIESQIKFGQRDGFEVITEMRQMLIDAGVESIDYATIVNPETLETLDPIVLPGAALIAAYVGKTRLIDNRVIESL